MRRAPWSIRELSRAWKVSSSRALIADTSWSPTRTWPAGREEPAEEGQQGRLAGPGRAEQADDFARLDGQVDPGQGRDIMPLGPVDMWTSPTVVIDSAAVTRPPAVDSACAARATRRLATAPTIRSTARAAPAAASDGSQAVPRSTT